MSLRYVLLVTTVLETLLFSGLHFGIGSLSLIFNERKIYAHLCPSNGTNTSATLCEQRDQKISLAMSLSSIGPFLVPFFGYILDKFGFHRVKWIPLSIYILASLSLFFLKPGYDWLIFPALIGYATSGFMIQTSNMKVANAFDTTRGLVLAFINGAFDSSAANFEFIRIIYRAGLDFPICVALYGILGSLSMVATSILYRQVFVVESRRKSVISGYNNRELEEEETKINEQPLLTWRFAVRFSIHVFWTCVLAFTVIISITINNTIIKMLTKNEQSMVDHMASAMSYILFCGILVAPIPGLLVDGLRSVAGKCVKLKDRKYHFAVLVPVVLTSLLSIVSCLILILARNFQIMYASYIVTLLLRSFVFSFTAVYVAFICPKRLFGTLLGITTCISGAAYFFQYPVVLWIQSVNSYQGVFILLLALSFATLSNPLALWFL